MFHGGRETRRDGKRGGREGGGEGVGWGREEERDYGHLLAFSVQWMPKV